MSAFFSLSTASPRAGPSTIPYEIFLNIVDIMVSEAEHSAQPIDMMFEGTRGGYSVEVDPFLGRNAPHRRRFQQLRLILQISRWTRAAVHRQFHRMPMGDANDDKTTVGWVYPRIDRFMPLLESAPHEGRLLRLVLRDKTFAQCLVNIQGLAADFFKYQNMLDTSLILCLPNVRELTLGVETFRELDMPDSPSCQRICHQ